MEQRNEPTTAEIVDEFKRITADSWRACDGCDLKALLRQAIDRLERLERDLAAEKNGMLILFGLRRTMSQNSKDSLPQRKRARTRRSRI